MRKRRLQERSPDDDDDGHKQPACDRPVEEQEKERGAEEEEAAGPSLVFFLNRHLTALCKQTARKTGLENKMWKELSLKKIRAFALKVALSSEKKQMECN